MAKDKEKTEEPKQDSVDKRLGYIERTLKDVIIRLEKQFGIDLNDNDIIGGWIKPWAMCLILAMSVGLVLAAEDVQVRYFASEGNDAVIQLEADEGDDAADELEIIMKADGTAALSVGGTEVVTFPASANRGTVSASTVSAQELGNDILHQTVLTLTAHPCDVTGATGVGWGTTNLYTFPEGHIKIDAIHVDGLTISTNVVGVGAAANDGDFSFGTTGTSDTTLDGTDVDLMAKTTDETMNLPADAINTATENVLFDGSSAAKTLNLNVLFDDDSTEADGNAAIGGVITVTWKFLGDD